MIQPLYNLRTYKKQSLNSHPLMPSGKGSTPISHLHNLHNKKFMRDNDLNMLLLNNVNYELKKPKKEDNAKLRYETNKINRACISFVTRLLATQNY